MGEEISSRVGAAIEAEIAPLLKLTNGPEFLSLSIMPRRSYSICTPPHKRFEDSNIALATTAAASDLTLHPLPLRLKTELVCKGSDPVESSQPAIS